MAGQDRAPDHSLTDDPLGEARRFSFFQLVQLLERHYRPAARVGRQGPASGEVLRFRPEASLAFPPSDVVALERVSDPDAPPRFRLTTTFMGLYGITSPLPAFYTEELLAKDSDGDAVRAFIDLFHHRLLSLFYRSWSKYRYHTQFEPDGADEVSQRLLGLIGLGTAGLTSQTGTPPVRLIRYAGLLSQRSRSAAALEGMLSDAFDGLPVRIESCTGRWVTIAPEQRSALGRSNCRLGEDLSIGGRVFGRGGAFLISIGPMSFERFTRFLPGGEDGATLEALVTFFLRDRLDFDVELRVTGHEIPRVQLASAGRARLGWTTWLDSDEREEAGERSVVFQR